MNKKLYVGGISFQASEDDLNNLFASIAQPVSAKIIMDRESGRSRGFGFVEMATEEDAQKAIDQLNGTEQWGRTISVSVAQEKTEGGPRRGGNGGGDRRPFQRRSF
ncbi:MAG TPA: RNA-binding protein [Candidatus Paceibacterota bacterium]|nr:RNA-binding protein [Candidatus Paceibacterota bacterium]